MIRPGRICAFLVWAGLLQHLTVPHVSAEPKGVEVLFRIDDKAVKGPAEIIIEFQDRLAVVEVRDDIPPFAPWSPPHSRVVVLPDWAVSTDGSVSVSVKATFKSRMLHFQAVRLWQGMGRLTFLVDRAPFHDNVDSVLGEKRSHVTEAHALFLDPVDGDGYVVAYPANRR